MMDRGVNQCVTWHFLDIFWTTILLRSCLEPIKRGSPKTLVYCKMKMSRHTGGHNSVTKYTWERGVKNRLNPKTYKNIRNLECLEFASFGKKHQTLDIVLLLLVILQYVTSQNFRHPSLQRQFRRKNYLPNIT